MISISDISIIEDTDFFLMTILIKWTEKTQTSKSMEILHLRESSKSRGSFFQRRPKEIKRF